MSIEDAKYQQRIYDEHTLMKSALVAIASRTITGEKTWQLANAVLDKMNTLPGVDK